VYSFGGCHTLKARQQYFSNNADDEPEDDPGAAHCYRVHAPYVVFLFLSSFIVVGFLAR
jgi:hypothetical protein